jgi:histidinol-phosphatase (PHP family)
MTTIPLISYHGSHSGEFCSHAGPYRLEEIVKARIKKGFTHFGLTEHQFIGIEKFIYPEDREAGKRVEDLALRFADYMREARRLQRVYHDKANILVGFETEVYDDSCVFLIEKLRSDFEPDYIVGSVHHIAGIPFDINETCYRAAVQALGGLENLYRRYYDIQYELIEKTTPEVIGHFDIIKIFSGTPDIPPGVWPVIERNIEKVAGYGGVIEVNTRSFMKGMTQPYPGEEILRAIARLGGRITLGDDSHSLEDIGYRYDLLEKLLPKHFKSVTAFEKTENFLKKKRIALIT